MNHEMGLSWMLDHAEAIAKVRGQLLVIKVGGSIQDQPDTMRSLMGEVAALSRIGAQVVVVHGGGKAITAAMAAAGLQAKFVGGQRFTDESTLRIAERVLGLGVNAELVGYVKHAGARAVGLHSLGTCVLRARRVKAAKPEDDLGFVGEVIDVDGDVLRALAMSGVVPVVAPVAIDVESGERGRDECPGKLNVNADLAAGRVADALKPDAMLLVSDTPGVRVADGSYVKTLSVQQIQQLKRDKVIDGGMLPKVQACLDAIAAGVGHVRIVDGRVRTALLGAALQVGETGTRLMA